MHCLTRSDVKRMHKYESRKKEFLGDHKFIQPSLPCMLFSLKWHCSQKCFSLNIFVYALFEITLMSLFNFYKRFRHVKRLSATSFAWLKQAERQPCLVITKSLLFVGLIGLSTLNMEVSPSLSLLCTYTRPLTSHQSEVDSEKENGRWH